MAGAPHLEKFLSTAEYFVGLKESGNNTFTDPRGREMLALYGDTDYVGYRKLLLRIVKKVRKGIISCRLKALMTDMTIHCPG